MDNIEGSTKERRSMKRFCIVLVVITSCLWVWLPLAHTSQVRPVPDFDQNGTVDFPDFLLFVGKFGSKQGDENYEDRFDLDGNGAIDFSDFLSFVNDFGKTSLSGGDENDVNIPDANLRAVIADSLGKTRDEAITRAEMATLTHLEVQDANISDLTGLQFATNLTYLWLTGNPITDLSALCDLTKLTGLVLFGNAITDISTLANLQNVGHLNLGGNNISDISALANLTNLSWLAIGDNAITDLSALANLINLDWLDISGMSISDISALANLTNLRELNLDYTGITDLSALSNLTNLIRLGLTTNAITDISALANLINLESLDLGSNSISDISALSNLTNLTYLNLSDNTISDLSSLVANTGIGGGDRVFVANNPLSDESLATHLPALYSRFDQSAYHGPCVPILPKTLSVDAGSSHTLQTTYYLHVDHKKIRPPPPTAAIAYVDFNEDGHKDILYAPGIGTRPFPLAAELYLNNGAGNFYPDTNFFGGNPPRRILPRKALTGDFNGDGRMDVFVLCTGLDKPPFPGESSYVILSSPNGYVLGSGLDTFIGFHHGGASADIDNDGDLDVFSTSTPAGVPYFLINDGTGSFTKDAARIEGIDHEQTYTAELVDVDGDDFLDLLVGGHEYGPEGEGFPTQILWGDSTGVFSTTNATILPSVVGHGVVPDIDVSDTDGDGDKDIVINRTGSGDENHRFYQGYYLQLVEQVGKRSFEDKTAQLLFKNEDINTDWITWIRMCDCNGDGHVDIVADDGIGRIFIWENDGTGAFRPR